MDRDAPDGGSLGWAREAAADHSLVRAELGPLIDQAERAILERATPAGRASRGAPGRL